MTPSPASTVIGHPALWRARDVAVTHQSGAPTRHATLDIKLPGSGWPSGKTTGLLTDCCGHGELSLLLPLMVEASHSSGWLVWVAPPHMPGMSARSTAGLRGAHLRVIRASTAGARAWSLRQALRSGAGTVIAGWIDRIDTPALRLQLVLFRPASDARPALLAVLRLPLSLPASKPLHLSPGMPYTSPAAQAPGVSTPAQLALTA